MSRALEIAEACVMRHGEKAWRLAYSLMRNTADADDLLQQSFIIAWRKADTFPRDATWPWLAGIISLEARNLRRKRARHAHSPLHDAAESPMNLDPAHDSQRRELSARLHTAMGNLAPDQREALALTHIGGLTQQQAAKALDVPLNTLKARVRRGLDALRGKLSAEEDEINSAMHSLPIALPVGGLTAAQAKWLAGVKAEAVVVGGTAAVAVSKKALIATLAAGVVMLVAIWFVLQGDPHQVNAPSSDLAERPAAYDDSGMQDKPTANQPGKDGRANDPKETGGYEGIPGEDHEGIPNRPFELPPPEEDEDETPELVDAGADPAEEAPPGEPAPEGESFVIQAKSSAQPEPVLWIPEVTRGSPVSPRHSKSSEMRDFLKEFYDDETSLKRRYELLEAVYGADHRTKDFVPVFEMDLWQFRLLAIPVITELTDESTIDDWWDVVEDAVRRGQQTQVAGYALRGLTRNPVFMEDKDRWEDLVEEIIYDYEDRVAPAELMRILLMEMGHFRGEVGRKSKTETHNRERAELLLEVAEWVLKVRKREADTSIVKKKFLPADIEFYIEMAFECLTGTPPAVLWDKCQRGILKAKVKRSNYEVMPLMKRRHYFELDGVDWACWAIERVSRPTMLPVVFLPDIDWRPDIYLPWMLPLDREFPCLFLEHPNYTDVMGDERTDPTLPDHFRRHPVDRLSNQLELLRQELDVPKIGLAGWGASFNVMMDYCLDNGEHAAFWIAGDGWTSEAEVAANAPEWKGTTDVALQTYRESFDVRPLQAEETDIAKVWLTRFLKWEGRWRYLFGDARDVTATLAGSAWGGTPWGYKLLPPAKYRLVKKKSADTPVFRFSDRHRDDAPCAELLKLNGFNVFQDSCGPTAGRVQWLTHPAEYHTKLREMMTSAGVVAGD